LTNAAFTIAVALAAGMIAQVTALHLRIPGIVVLLLAGVLLGPDVSGVVQPDTLGAGLGMIVSAAVAVILFEGGLHLEIGRLRHEAITIRRLVTWGAAVTGIIATLAARFLMDWPWQVAVPFGTLVIVTGPTVITPLLRRIRVNRNLHTILEAEGVLIDPIGAIIAVVALEVVLAQELGTAALDLVGIPTRLLFGLFTGLVGGFLMAKILEFQKIVPERFESVFTLALLLFLFELTNLIMPESGIMTAPIAGMVVGNMPSRPNQSLKEFKEQLTLLLVGLLFVLLAADVRIQEVTGLGWRGVATVLVLMLVARPLDVAVSTHGSTLTFRERAFMSWLGPRGIVAAAVASVFAETLVSAGIPEGVQLRALVFLVIAFTVVLQGLSGGAVAKMLAVRRPSDVGYVIAGANPLARSLARCLRDAGEEIVLIDADLAQVAAARQSDLPVIYGNALDDDVLQQADAEGRRGVIGLIPNEWVNVLVAQKVRSEFRVSTAFVAVRPGRSPVPSERLQAIRARRLFGGEFDIDAWIGRIAAGRVRLEAHRYSGFDERSATEPELRSATLLPLMMRRGDRAVPVDELTRFRPGDVVTFALVDGSPPPADFVPDTAEGKATEPAREQPSYQA
jgi:NhaP-type Na+/H+ or K+/H+ antiporter